MMNRSFLSFACRIVTAIAFASVGVTTALGAVEPSRPAPDPVIPTVLAAQAEERSVFLSPFLPQAQPSSVVQGATQVQYLSDLVDMLPSRGIFDLVQFPLPGGVSVDLWLTEFKAYTDSSTFVVMKPGPNGSAVADYTIAPKVRTFRGRVTGADDSVVFLAFAPESVNGFITLDGKTYSISNGPRGELPVTISDLKALPEGAINWFEYMCQVREGGAGAGGGDGGVAALAACKVVEIAFETDNEFRGLFPSDQAALDYLTQIVAGMNTIYLQEQNLFPLGTFFRIWSPGTTDPWQASGTPAQLDQFVAAWGGGGGPPGSNPRDLAHLVSARNLGGGIAYLNAVCNPGLGFAVSGNISGFFPYPLQSNNSQNWDIVVTTHEMGHNCGCNHTHDLGVDGCGNGNCAGAANGTIMSYCHLCAPGMSNIALVFAQANKNQMDQFLGGLGCLSEPCPIYDPAQFTASDGSFVDAVRLAWIPPAVLPLRYEIERREIGGAFASLAANVSATASTYSDISAAVGTIYEYRIRAIRVDTGNPSDWVGPDQGSKGVLGPTGLQASDGEYSGKVKLVWSAPTGYTPIGYAIFRATVGGAMALLDQIDAGVTSYDDDGSYDCYAASPIECTFDPLWPDTDDDGVPGPPPETEPGIVYVYEVRAIVNADLVSAPSSNSGFRATPGPTNLVATGGINSTEPPLTDRVRLSWSLPGTVNGVYIYRATSNTSTFVQVAYLTGSQTRWNDFATLPDVAYSYKVQSFSNLLGLSAPSDVDLGFRLIPPTVTSASAGSFTNKVNVRWAKPSGWNPSDYNVWRRRAGNYAWPANPIATVSSTTLQFDDTDVENGAVYVYAVAAKSANFNSFSDRGATRSGYPTVLAPTAVTASDGTYPGFVEVTWQPTGTTQDVTWQVWRRRANSGTAYSLIKTVNQPVHLDNTAQAGVVYQYQIRTRAQNGVTSAPSAPDTGFR